MFFYFLVVTLALVVLVLLVIGRFTKALGNTWADGGLISSDVQTPAQVQALVFLLRRPRPLTLPTVLQAARRAFALPFAPDNPNAFVISTDRPETFIVKTPHAALEVLNSQLPYRENLPAAIGRSGDIPGIDQMTQHQAWIAVNLLQAQSQPGLDDPFRSVARLLSEFANEDCVGLFCPSTGQLVAYTPQVIPVLQSFHPLEAFPQK